MIYAITLCLSVYAFVYVRRLSSVSVKIADYIVTKTILHNYLGTLLFWLPKVLLKLRWATLTGAQNSKSKVK